MLYRSVEGSSGISVTMGQHTTRVFPTTRGYRSESFPPSSESTFTQKISRSLLYNRTQYGSTFFLLFFLLLRTQTGPSRCLLPRCGPRGAREGLSGVSWKLPPRPTATNGHGHPRVLATTFAPLRVPCLRRFFLVTSDAIPPRIGKLYGSSVRQSRPGSSGVC